jgi:hypothetical protein
VLVNNAGPDTASRAVLRLLRQWLPEMSVIDGASSLEQTSPGDPPILRSAQLVEGSAMRAIRIAGLSRDTTSDFGAFLDGTQRVRVIGHHFGLPIVLGTVSAAIRVRVNRRLTTWGHQPPRVDRKIYAPLRYIPSLANISPGEAGEANWQIVDTSTADKNGENPSQHPVALFERATRAVDRDREALEDELAEAWCARGEAPLFVDGGISRSARVSASSCAIGVIKSHRTLYVEGDALRTVMGLKRGERSSIFRVSPRSRNSVLSWYLRLRDADGHDPMWGLVRVEAAESERAAERADEVSRWVIAETSPLALPDGRWDKMSYGIRDCEEFLRAIS